MLKLFKDKNGVINIHGVSSLIRTFAKGDNWHNIEPLSGNLGYGWLHYAFIRNIQPNRVLCIGSRYGYIPAICALACKDNKRGVVDFVDANYDENRINDFSRHWGGLGYWNTKKGKDSFSNFNLKTIRTHLVTSKEFYSLSSKSEWGYIYIDGDHSYKGIKYDFEHFWPLLKIGGFLAIHDIYTKNIGILPYGVHTYWKELKRSHGYHTMEFSGECGLGIVQKM